MKFYINKIELDRVNLSRYDHTKNKEEAKYSGSAEWNITEHKVVKERVTAICKLQMKVELETISIELFLSGRVVVEGEEFTHGKLDDNEELLKDLKSGVLVPILKKSSMLIAFLSSESEPMPSLLDFESDDFL